MEFPEAVPFVDEFEEPVAAGWAVMETTVVIIEVVAW